ncbi:MAG TPA: hypothetical protein VMF67_10225, partial [Rhizomicrobium sp.]|nr:hypothetical protein [Rhizomicrobium sp.]
LSHYTFARKRTQAAEHESPGMSGDSGAVSRSFYDLCNTADRRERSMTDHAHDFDFLIGKWHVHRWRLKERLAGSRDWVELEVKGMIGLRP